MLRRERWWLAAAALVVIVVIGVGLGRSTGAWRWTARGTLAYHARCSNEGHAQVPDTCVFQVPNPPSLAHQVTLDVRMHNTTATRVCYGLSVTTSYLSGLQSFCVKPHARGGYETTNQARFFVDFTLDVFVSTSASNQPLTPTRAPGPSPFTVTVSQKRR